MRLGRFRVSGGSIVRLVSVASGIACLLIACANGTEPIDLTEGALDAEGGTVLGDGGPSNRDSGTIDPTEDAGGTDAKKDSTTPPTGVNHVVINELQADGTEFVELYNPTGASISLNGYSIKYQSAAGGAGSAGNTFKAADSIGAGAYLLLTKANGKWTEGMAAASGQIGLFNGSTLVDGVAYGAVTGGSYGEGSPAPTPPSAGSIGRQPDGADTNKNATDFATFTSPTPGSAN